MTDSSSEFDSRVGVAVVVVGGGIMGRGIAAAMQDSGQAVTIVETDAGASARLRDAGFTVADALESVVPDADLVIEAVPEVMAIKEPLWRRLGELARTDAVLASNTSAFDIDGLASFVAQPQRVLGMHWFTPATVVPCVELVRGVATADEVLDRMRQLLSAAGKRPVVVRNSPGFVANRIQFALVREALLCLEEGLASAEDIDAIVSSSFGPRLAVLGPLANADLGGLDTYRSILTFLSAQLGERFAVPRVLDDLVAEGRLGVKSGRGIYEYTPESASALTSYRDSTLRRVLATVAEAETERDQG